MNCEGYVQIIDEILLFVYVAGHGCADTSQYFVLNEHDIDKAFWNIEEQLMELATRCGNSLKIFVVYDICREPIEVTKKCVQDYIDKK